MIYGDNPQKINERQDALGLRTYSYAPQILSIMQAGNLYVYCVDNPLFYVDPSGNDALGKLFTVRALPADGGGGGDGTAAGGGILILLLLWIDSTYNHVADSLSKITTPKKYKSYFELHHIVAQNSMYAKPAANILNELFVNGVNDEANLVPLKTVVHRRLHTKLYYAAVNLIILNAYYSANGDRLQQEVNVRSALSQLAVFLLGLNDLAP